VAATSLVPIIQQRDRVVR